MSRGPAALCFSALALLLRLNAYAAKNADPALIQIGVEIVEVDEKRAHTLGIDWISSVRLEESAIPSLLKVGTINRSALFADLQLLSEQGAADLLANPKLVTREGTTASFHAGGEFPYAVAGSLGTVSVEFKAYGVDLKINPHLDDSGRIALSIQAEISGPDPQNSVTLAGNTVPGIRSRHISSELSLAPGDTLTLAGLIQTQKETVRRGIPGLMHIPILKYLFSHKTEIRRRTSVIAFITPTLVTPQTVPPQG
jgi:pilus assembly protein CpaC